MTIIIAELGTAFADEFYSGTFATAMRLARRAVECGADIIKAQLFVLGDPLFCPLPGDEGRQKRWHDAIMEDNMWLDLAFITRARGREFAISIFQLAAIPLALQIKPVFWKVASRAAKTFPYDKCPGPFLVSNGMGLPDKLPANAKVLSCVSKYPTPLREAFWPGDTAGLSDHSGSILPGLDAIERGAEYLEVHFDDGYGDGPDRAVSLNPDQLRKLCEARDAARSRAAPSGRRARAH